MANLRCCATDTTMRQELLVAIIVTLTTGCSIDYSTRVGDANRAVIRFLNRYAKYQADLLSRTGAYKDPFSFAERSNDADALAEKYAAVKRHSYACRFDVGEARFTVVCTPNSGSGLELGFYVDESGAVRMARGVPNRSSPMLALDPNADRDLYGEDLPRKQLR